MTAAVALTLGLGLAGPITPASALFPDRAYELVTPGSTNGHAVGPTHINFDGTQIITESGGGFAETPSVAGTGNTYAHLRTAFGWTTRPLNLPKPEYDIAGQRVDVSEDFGATLHRGAYTDEAVLGRERYFIRLADGTVAPASPPLQNGQDINQSSFTQYRGAADDLSSFAFGTNAGPLLPPPDARSGGSNTALYEVYGARTLNPGLRRIDVDSSGVPINVPCGGLLGSNQRNHNAISANGSRIFFSSNPNNSSPAACTVTTRGPTKLYARINGAQTIELSQSRCTRTVPGSDPPVSDCLTWNYAVTAERTPSDSVFQGASDDGGSVFFTTGQQLINSDVDRTIDLYEYRFGVGGAPASLLRLTEGVPINGPADGARVLGVARVSDNGRRVAFVAQGVLTTESNAAGLQAVDGQNNLYLYERTAAHPNGRVVFISTIAASDSALWGLDSGRPALFADPAGRHLLLSLQTQLTPDDSDDGADAFLYDAETGDVLRISKGKNGYSNNGNQLGRPVFLQTPSYSQGDRVHPNVWPISTDASRIVFRTDEPLQLEDVNGVTDIYEWRDGQVELVTPGKSQRPLGNILTMSRDGASIAFSAGDALVPQDVDDAVGAYVARSGGGFEYEEPEVETPCEGDSCQDAPNVPLSPLGLPTVGLSGSGNAVPWRDSISVAAVSAVQRRVAARTGRVRIAVRTSSGGTVTATASARVAAVKGGRAKVRTVGSASATVRRAGARQLTLRLSPAARRQLKAGKRLAITVRVGFSKTSKPVTTRLTLTGPKGGKA